MQETANFAPSYCAEAQKSYEAHLAGDPKAINPNLRSAVFDHAVRQGGQDAYESVKKLFNATTANDIRERLLSAMCKVQTPDLVEDLLDFTLSTHVAVQDVHYGTAGLAANPKARPVQWAYIKRNWDAIMAKIGGNFIVLDRFVQQSIGRFASFEAAEDVAGFFEGKDTKGYDKGVAQKLDAIRGNARYNERDGELVLEWLRAKGYA